MRLWGVLHDMTHIRKIIGVGFLLVKEIIREQIVFFFFEIFASCLGGGNVPPMPG